MEFVDELRRQVRYQYNTYGGIVAAIHIVLFSLTVVMLGVIFGGIFLALFIHAPWILFFFMLVVVFALGLSVWAMKGEKQ